MTAAQALTDFTAAQAVGLLITMFTLGIGWGLFARLTR